MTAFYHRVVDCLLPKLRLLAAIDLQLEEHGRACVVAQGNGKGTVAWPYIAALTLGPDVRFHEGNASATSTAGILQRIECWQKPACLIRRGASWTCPGQQDLPVSKLFTKELHDYPPSSKHLEGMQQMWNYVRRIAGPAGAGDTHVLLASRGGAGRGFPPGGQEQLVNLLQRVVPGPVRVYRGNETLVQMLALFARASTFVGVHGAAFANIAFTPQRICVHELTVASLKGSHELVEFSTARYMTTWSPHIAHFHHVASLEAMLAVNNASSLLQRRPPLFMEPWTHRTEIAIRSVMAIFPLEPLLLAALERRAAACEMTWVSKGYAQVEGRIVFADAQRQGILQSQARGVSQNPVRRGVDFLELKGDPFSSAAASQGNL